MTDHHDLVVALCQHASTCNRMRVTIDDDLDRLLSDSADGLEHELTIVPGVAGVERDEAVFRLDDAHRRKPIAAKHPDPWRRILDRRLEPVEVTDPIEQFLAGNGPVCCFHQLNGGTHVPGWLYAGISSLHTGGQANFTATDDRAVLHYRLPWNAERYRLGISSKDPAGKATAGNFRLLIGLNAPEVLQGNGEPGGLEILQEPIPVSIGMKMQQLTSVNQKSENFGVVVTIVMHWQDPRLAYNPKMYRTASRSSSAMPSARR
jgi:hypothetical protein